MNDLFRFVLARPANLPDKDETNTLKAPFLTSGVGWARARALAAEAVEKGKVLGAHEELPDADLARAVVELLRAGPRPAAEIEKLVEDRSGKALGPFTEVKRFAKEVEEVSSTLVALKLLSHSIGRDTADLTTIARGLDAISRAAEGIDPVRLRPLVLPSSLTAGGGRGEGGTQTHEPPSRGPITSLPGHDPAAEKMHMALGEAIQALGSLTVDELQPATGAAAGMTTAGQRSSTAGQGAERAGAAAAARPSSELALTVENPWGLSAAGVKALPAGVRSTLKTAGLDPATQTLPVMVNALHAQQLAQETAPRMAFDKKIDAAADFVGEPLESMPVGHGTISPAGIGDLLLVREHVKSYEGGEIAHTENVLQSESLSRETRRLERTETTLLQEEETTKEEERDTQTTERSSLSSETQKTIQTDAELKAGLSVDAKYGPFVEVKANAEFATKSAQQEAQQQSSEYSKDIVARAVSKIVEKVRQQRTTTTLNEYEEKYSHGFDNTHGTGNISGVYQWLNEILEAQIYNYGRRMLFDVTLPEPATEIMQLEASEVPTPHGISEPPTLTINASEITEANYTYYAALYDATGLDAPPAPVKTFSKAFGGVQPDGHHEGTGTEAISIDADYAAKYAMAVTTGRAYEESSFRIIVGSHTVNGETGPAYQEMNGETGTMPVSFDTWEVESYAFNVEVYCERTEQSVEKWKLKTFAAIQEAYVQKQTAYRQALNAAQAEAATAAYGRSPGLNAEVINSELRKQCLTLLTGQEFEGFGALELSPEGYAQPNLTRTDEQMPYVRFFEQAFEWEHITYFFYPYFWGWKQAWNKRMLLDDNDPTFAEFLRAGAARVVFPVRPGFEEAVLHYLETGEIWGGGPPPTVNSELYVPIVKEIQEAEGAPGEEVAEGEPWPVVLPTTLVHLRADDKLPEWKLEGEEWVPAN
ncbi:MAG TPA: hypothetical protein VGH14_06845 [Solirubrobacterales bacterium]|jgi:hypothetical protein